MKKHFIVAVVVFLSAVSTTYAQTPASNTASSGSVCLSLLSNLQFGARDTAASKNVWLLQSFLQANGYLSSSPSGYFGIMTDAAVKSYQSVNSIPSTGFVGVLTRAKIKAASCSNNTPPTTSIIPPATAPAKTTLKNPTINSFTSTKTTIGPGENSTLSWNVTDATSCILQYDSIKESVVLSGNKLVTPITQTTYTLRCVREDAFNKDVTSSEKSLVINIQNAEYSATIDQSSLISSSSMPTLTGYANSQFQVMSVVITSVQGDNARAGGTMIPGTNRWAIKVNAPLSPGQYHVELYTGSGARNGLAILLASGNLTITSK